MCINFVLYFEVGGQLRTALSSDGAELYSATEVRTSPTHGASTEKQMSSHRGSQSSRMTGSGASDGQSWLDISGGLPRQAQSPSVQKAPNPQQQHTQRIGHPHMIEHVQPGSHSLPPPRLVPVPSTVQRLGSLSTNTHIAGLGSPLVTANTVPLLQPSVIQPGSGSLFRPPGTATEIHGSQQHLYSASPMLHTPYQHSSSGIPSYSPFYPSTQLPPGYSGSLLSPRHYLHMDSYSAVLASMGTHAQGHLPRFQLPIPTGQFLPKSPQLETAVGPSGYAQRSQVEPPLRAQPMSPQGKADSRLSVKRRSTSPMQTDITLHSPELKGLHGREGSLKHRILTQPSGSAEHSGEMPPRRYRMEQLSPSKRTRTMVEGQSWQTPPPMTRPSVTHLTQSTPASSHMHHPSHFMQGSLIQLADGKLKRVEDLQTEDFINSADISSDLRIDSSTVVKIEEKAHTEGYVSIGFSVREHRVQVRCWLKESNAESPLFNLLGSLP